MGKSPQTGCKVEAYYRIPLGRLTKTVADSFWVDFLSSILSCVPRISACQKIPCCDEHWLVEHEGVSTCVRAKMLNGIWGQVHTFYCMNHDESPDRKLYPPNYP